MKSDQEPGSEEQELMKLWRQELLPGHVDPAQIAREVAAKVKQFDRGIWWRNFREYAVGLILIVFFSWRSFDPASRIVSLAGIVAVLFVTAYMWRSHRNTTPLDPAADGASYRAALINRYDHQIRLLSKVKYWYVLPLYLWMLLSVLMYSPPHDVGRRWRGILVVTAFSLFVVWLNEGPGVRKLKAKRKQAEAFFEEGKD